MVTNEDQKVPSSALFNLLQSSPKVTERNTSGLIPDLPYMNEEPMSVDSRQVLPDIDCLFNDIRINNEAKRCIKVEIPNDSEYSAFQLEESNLLDLDQPLQGDEVTFYDESSLYLNTNVKVKTEVQYYNTTDDIAADEKFQLQRMESMVFEQVSKDIEFACKILDIPEDPSCWTVDNVQKWAVWTLKQYNLLSYHAESFRLPGSTLQAMTEADFARHSPQAGPTLYAQLEIWKNAFKCNMSSSSSTASLSPSYYPSYCGPLVTDFGTMQSTSQDPFLGSVPERHTVSPHPSEDSLDSHGSSYCSTDVGFSSDKGVETTSSGRHTIHLWQFLKELLMEPGCYGNCIRWVDRSKGIFKIEDSVKVARLWGKRKNRPAMNYDKLSRSIRQYYKKRIIRKTEHSKRLVYQFCPGYL
ncbi:SAM pointed domain-containing Ets transcription factor [Lingula anatina]|uniref:SAM pointed domain-containing Ets transcription factor n=1 Tax=Lingula anatina TaxID=7574 RepID=A0A1S3ISQ0_LINAN|nr:SAM pointed domain-containing Ets transcription factor [Lingula anatina]|eukprot:XP_013384668.1 SAM pointed domain-containing Ets transcription factor [Lingula anatina]